MRAAGTKRWGFGVARRGEGVSINPDLLVWARETAGYDLDALAELMRMEPDQLAAWESGEAKPTIRQLESFAQKVKRPLATLFMRKPPQSPSPPQDFRLLPESDPKKFEPDTLLAFRRARNIQREAKELAAELGRTPAPQLLRFTQETSAEAAAQQARKFFGISLEEQVQFRDSYNALNTWKYAVERSGVLVLQYPLPLQDARGFTLFDPEFPLIGLSTKDPAVARVFSLFHEYCHLTLGHTSVSSPRADLVARRSRDSDEIRTEVYCNEFAASFLLPYDEPEVRTRLTEAAHNGDPDDLTIEEIARRYKVSRYVVLRRMQTKELIPDNVYHQRASLWASRSSGARQIGGGDYYANVLSQASRRFTSMVFEAYDRNLISEFEASDYLDISLSSLSRYREEFDQGVMYE